MPISNNVVSVLDYGAKGDGVKLADGALVRDIHARDEIDNGRLALALDRPWPTGFA